MCRFTLYLGPSIRLGKLLTEPSHSLIRQSFHAAEREEPLNGDGFGVGWYAPRLSAEPALFHSVTPAWNNRNLKSLARVVTSPCVLAHVRAATEGEVNLANCHPFAHGRYLLMHNGNVGSFRKVRRRMLRDLSDEAFGVISGSTDTEHLFAVFVDALLKQGDPLDDPDPARCLAMRLSETLATVLAIVGEAGDRAPSYLNVAVSNGEHAAVTRFTSDPGETPDSLYYLHGEPYVPTAKEFAVRRVEYDGAAVLVSSERLTADPGWRAVPASHVIAFSLGAEPRLFELGPDGRMLA